MPVNRRTLIKTVGGSAAVTGLAGCLSVSENTETEADSGGNDDSSGTTDTSGDTATPTETPGTASFWHQRNQQGTQALQEDASAFNDASPHTIELSEIASLDEKTSSAIPAGDGPHLFEWAHDWSGDYWESGFLSDQSDQVDVDVESTYTDVALDAVQYKGNLVGLPYAAETVALLYNKDMVDGPPSTISEMQSMMEGHHDPSNNQFGVGYPFNPYFVSGYAQAFGGTIFDGDSEELGIASDATIRGFRTAIEEFTPFMPDDTSWGPQTSVFLEERSPFAINGPWFLQSVRDNDINFGVAPLPAPEGGSPRPFTGIKMWYFAKKMDEGVPENAEAARSFAEWYTTNEDLLTSNAENLGYIPVHQDVVDSDDLGEVIAGFKESVNMGMGMPVNPKMGAVWAEMGPALSKAVSGESTVEEAMTTAASNIRDEWES